MPEVKNSDTLVLELLPEYSGTLKRIIAFFKTYAEYFILIIAATISFWGWQYYFDQGLILSYNDAMSHLDISRRVVEGLTPGIAQIGSVWLPLLHLLMLPFVWNDFLWHSGLAGSIISNLAFIGSTLLIFRFGKLLTGDRLSGLLAALIFALNPNMIYLQSIPMTESLLMFFLIASSYYFLLWKKTGSYRPLIAAAFVTLLGSMTRYDGWALLVQMVFVLGIISLRKGGYKKLESNIILFCTLACYGAVLWFVWNYLIFSDALYFLNGPFSAKAQQLVFESEGRLFSKGNIGYSSYVYLLAVIKNIGGPITILGSIGAVSYLFRKKLSNETFALSLLLSPLFFNLLALYLGHSIININDLPPYTLFNVRYGIMMLPAIAIFIAYLTRKQKLMQFMVAGLLVIQVFMMYQEDEIITVKDGIYGASAQGMSETGSWLNKNTQNGLILIAASSQDSLIFQSGLSMKQFIHEGTGDIWKGALKNPSGIAEFVAMHRGDLVYRELNKNPDFLNNYTKVYDGEFTDIYKKSLAEKPLTEEDLP